MNGIITPFKGADLPQNAVGLRLCKIFPGEELRLCEAVRFTQGRPAVDTVLRRAAVSGRVEIGGDLKDHWADIMTADGSWEEVVALDAQSFKALKDHWMRCHYERPLRKVPIMSRPMKRIPIRAAEDIAKDYGYDQVIIIARRVGEEPEPHGEHLTTYGINKVHCDVAARTGSFIKYKIMDWPWPRQIATEPLYAALKRLHGWGKEQMLRLGVELEDVGPGRDLFEEVEEALALYEKEQA